MNLRKIGFIFLLLGFSLSLLLAGSEPQTKDNYEQLIENKVRIEQLEDRIEKITTTNINILNKSKEHTNSEIEKKIDRLVSDKNSILNYRENKIDWFMAFISIFIPIILLVSNFRFANDMKSQVKESKDEMKEQYRRSETIIDDIKIKFDNYLSKMNNSLDEIDNKKKEFEMFLLESEKRIYELIKSSSIKDGIENDVNIQKAKYKRDLESLDIEHNHQALNMMNNEINEVVAEHNQNITDIGIDNDVDTSNESKFSQSNIMMKILEKKDKKYYDHEDWLIIGNGLHQQRNFREALDAYNKAIKMYPNYQAAYINRGALYSTMGDYENAINDYSKGISLNPNDYIAYCNRGISFTHFNKFDQSIQDFTSAIKINKEDFYSYLLRGYANYDNNNYDDAILDFTSVLEIDPGNFEALKKRSLSYYFSKQWRKSITGFMSLISKQEADLDTYKFIGSSLVKLRKYPESLQYFKKAIEVNISAKSVYLDLLEAAIFTNRMDLWTKYCDKLIHLELDNCTQGTKRYLEGIANIAFKDSVEKIDEVLTAITKHFDTFDSKIKWGVEDLINWLNRENYLTPDQKERIQKLTDMVEVYIIKHNKKYEDKSD